MTHSAERSGNAPDDRVPSSVLEHLSQFTDEELAYHEAGHAVIYVMGGGSVSRLSIVRADPARGTRTDSPPPRPGDAGSPPKPPAPTGDAAKVHYWIDSLLAGEAAGYVHSGRRRPESSVGDRAAALEAARTVAADDAAAQAMVEGQWDGVVAQLREPATWCQVTALAGAVMREGTLEGDAIARVLASA